MADKCSEEDLRALTEDLLREASQQRAELGENPLAAKADSAPVVAVDASAITDDRLERMQSIVATSADVAAHVKEIFRCASETYLMAKQVNAMIRKHHTEFKKSMAKMKTNAPIVSAQLTRMSDRLDAVLAKAMSIDAASCNAADLAHRSQLIETAREWSRQISTLVMGLMAI